MIYDEGGAAVMQDTPCDDSPAVFPCPVCPGTTIEEGRPCGACRGRAWAKKQVGGR